MDSKKEEEKHSKHMHLMCKDLKTIEKNRKLNVGKQCLQMAERQNDINLSLQNNFSTQKTT